MTHLTLFRIYYEDTDAGGVVYYANYLKFAERARTEWLRGLGFSQSRLMKEAEVLFVVRHCAIDYLAPARLDDTISVETHLQELGKVRMTMRQSIQRESTELARLTVTLVCVNRAGKPVGWPQALLEALAEVGKSGNVEVGN